jgi:AsmA protein
MARHIRRLTRWLLAGVATLVLLALCALAALWWFIDPDDYRSQIEARASAAIGRAVHLTGALHWQLGKQVYIASEGGDIANAAGFGPEPLARWSRLRLGVALRPLFDKRVLIDVIDIDGLQLRLARNAQGIDNWQFAFAAGSGKAAASPVTLRIGAVKLSNGDVRYQDAGTGDDWHLSELALQAQLPSDLVAADREFRGVNLAGRVAGGPLKPDGERFSARADSLRLSPGQLQVPAFELQWADAGLSGGIAAQLGAAPDVTTTFTLKAPSLRALLATAGVTPPPMADPTTLGRLQFSTALHYSGNAATFEELSIALDDTQLTGKVSLPRMDPLSLRFDLAADRVDMDRYLEPDDVKSEPFELPLARLKALDAKGVLRIRQATVAGAAARQVRIDVE